MVSADVNEPLVPFDYQIFILFIYTFQCQECCHDSIGTVRWLLLCDKGRLFSFHTFSGLISDVLCLRLVMYL